jgi:hypothetical protein
MRTRQAMWLTVLARLKVLTRLKVLALLMVLIV